MSFKVTDRIRLEDTPDGTAMLICDDVKIELNGFELKCLKAACEEMIGICYRKVRDERRGL
jgi:hypothetical protein